MNYEKQPESLQATPISSEISVYRGDLTKGGMVRVREILFKAFPKFPNESFEVLKDRFKANGFSDERAIDAVNNVIDTYEGWDKLPNIANFVQYDKKQRVFTYYELLEMYKDNAPDQRKINLSKYKQIEIEGEKVYTRMA